MSAFRHDAVRIVGILIAGCLFAGTSACGRGSIRIQDNGYREILIAIGEEVPENIGLLDRIREVFTNTSAFLYQATRRRAYFADITILVPKTWSSQPEYGVAGLESHEKSDIVVGLPDTDSGQGLHTPFTVKTSSCGELGHYIHLTSTYLLNATIGEAFGPYEKTLVHEWAHLRYGLYDEYPTGTDGAHFYLDQSGDVEATKCTRALTGRLYDVTTGGTCSYNGSLPDGDCRFEDNLPTTSDSYGSLMYRQYLDHIYDFCDNDIVDAFTLHDYEAPTEQNLKCGGKSAWEVIREHPDFILTNDSRDVNDTSPAFRVVRQSDRQIVLILDVSGSMGPGRPGNKIAKLGQSCSTFITSVLRDGDSLGIVWFNSSAFPVRGMTELSNSTRQDLLDGVPRLAKGSTSIGAGIREGIQTLSRSGNTTGGILILVSDGEENTQPFIADVLQEVRDAMVTVHSVAVTDDADTGLDFLAQTTGGLSFLYSAQDQSNALNEAFRQIGELDIVLSDRKHVILSEADTVLSGGQYTGQFTVDYSLGREAEVIFDNSGNNLNIVLTSPTGMVYTEDSSLCSFDSSFGIYRFAFPTLIEQGGWSYEATNPNRTPCRVACSVSAKSARKGMNPIIAQVVWGRRSMGRVTADVTQVIYASVSQGYSPVLGAFVTAKVERPRGGAPSDITLLDNGAGADVTMNDGVYTAYFINFNAKGRYNMKVHVGGAPACRVSPRRVVGKGAADPSGDLNSQPPDVPVGDFARSATGGSFELETDPPTTPVYSPAKITDLRLVYADHVTRQVTLTWTAVGQYLDVGQASRYDLRHGLTYLDVREEFDNQAAVTAGAMMSGTLTSPAPAAVGETISFTVPDDGLTFYFAIVAIDERMDTNATGPISNIVSASMRPPPSDHLGPGSIAAIVVCVLLLLVLIAVAIVLGLKNVHRRATTAPSNVNTDAEAPQNRQTEKHRTERAKPTVVPYVNGPPTVHSSRAVTVSDKRNGLYKEPRPRTLPPLKHTPKQ